MNRVLLTAGALLMFVSSAAMAFDAFPNPVRVYTLSGGDGFNNNFILDSNDAYSWFGRIYRNADHVRVTWNPQNDGGQAQGLGFIKSEEGYGAYMLHFQQAYGYYPTRQEGQEYNHFTLGYGYPFGSFDLGLVYNRQGTSYNEEDTPEARVEASESYNTFGAGITYDMDDETAIDFSFMFTTGSEDDGVDEDPENDFETTGFGIGARAFKAWREDLTIIPAVLFSNYTEKEGDLNEDKFTSIEAGLAFDYTINEDNDLYLFLSFQSDKEEFTDMSGTEDVVYEYNYTAMPGIGAAVEHELTDMFTIRMGATKNWLKYEEVYPLGDEEITDEYKTYPWQFTFGMGIAMGDWVIDLALNQDWMYQAGYWFHGVQATGQPPVAQIEAKLWF